MPSFRFQPGFAPSILDGTKRQTICMKARCKVGDQMYLYSGLSMQNNTHVATHTCALVDGVRVSPEGLMLGRPELHPADEDEFAVLDGFQDYADMCRWYYRQYGTAYFHGFVHRWADVPAHSG